ncbi:MAG: hypothetical protein A3K19_30585 [Lentisphaerae bacterium RIFOXYB12_FULL_65_16]|nr:MAG: hypothetical protein A3K18_23410 [Lentisphaerae bacterium RIFOXYA12_64_32]OGV92151.1 MAG: hypothetical protein A3K19_30585 [Lentisphaerae bacterium RIFOXYB12_FULL_65_16]
MGKLSAFLGIVTALLAIAAVVLSLLLFVRRNEFRGRADKLASSVADIVAKLDKDSGTEVAKRVNFKAGDPASKTPESGSLGWKAYKDAKDPTSGTYPGFLKTLGEASNLADALNERRTGLADNLNKVATDLGIPEGQIEAEKLKQVLADKGAAFNENTARIHQLTAALIARDEAMIQTFVACGNVLQYPVADNAFRKRDEAVDENGKVTLGDFPVKVPLGDFSTKLTGLNTRCNDYAQTIVDGIHRTSKHKWETNPEQILNEREYGGALTTLLNDFDAINNTLVLYEKAKAEIAEQKAKIEELVDELDQTRQELNKANDTIVEQAIKIKNLTGGDPGAIGMDGAPVEIDFNLEGHVVQVNPDWNFIIIDQGRKKIKENMSMLVARGEELIGRIQISKVLPNISIAELLPEGQNGQVQVGDRVIFPKTQAASAGTRGQAAAAAPKQPVAAPAPKAAPVVEEKAEQKVEEDAEEKAAPAVEEPNE